MASQSGADPAPSPAATQAPTPPAGKPTDELLCTICGLTACWTKPGQSPKPAATATDSPGIDEATPA